MNKLWWALAFMIAFMTPWAWVLLVRPAEPVPEWCFVPYQIENESQPAGIIDATVRNHFKNGGVGSSILMGTVTFNNAHYQVHRVSDMTWYRQGDFMLINTHKVEIMPNDTLPAKLAQQILFTSSREEKNDYYQMYRLSNGDQIINYSGMPRLYCHQ
ncbi:hypothetical protein [Pantoea sp.]|uniref:hypothetical protein n=1 Tax=Pantoea sp. TaxID=69393 RepID=UPI0031CFFF3C